MVWWLVLFLMEMWLVSQLMWFGDDCATGDCVGNGNCDCPQSITGHYTKNTAEIAHPIMDMMLIAATIANTG